MAKYAGENGFVLATDPALPDYGSPATLGEAAGRLRRSRLGGRLEIRLGTNWRDVPETGFDKVVLSHCSWYFISPSQASVGTLLKVDLYGTAVLLEEVGKVIAEGGAGVTISSQSGHRMEALGAERDELLVMTPTEELLSLDMLQERNIRDTLHAYQMAKHCNVKRVMAEAIKWGVRGVYINSISPGIIVPPLAVDEFNGSCGDFYKNMFARYPAGRPGTADEITNVAELLLEPRGAFITGADFLIDGGATASCFYGPLKPTE